MVLEKIPLKDRNSIVFLGHGQVSVDNGALVFHDGDKNNEKVAIPAAGLACLMLEPGTRISHSAVKLANRVGCLLQWVGEGGVRLYSSAFRSGAECHKILIQGEMSYNKKARAEIVREMFRVRFGEDPPKNRSIDQLRGIEGSRVRETYQHLANKYGVKWNGRSYRYQNWDDLDLPNYCLSVAAACLNGLTEAAIRIAGFSPSVGFVHRGNNRSFVFDIADLYKLDLISPVAFKVASQSPSRPGPRVRHACRDRFRELKFLKKVIPTIKEVLKTGLKHIDLTAEGKTCDWAEE